LAYRARYVLLRKAGNGQKSKGEDWSARTGGAAAWAIRSLGWRRRQRQGFLCSQAIFQCHHLLGYLPHKGRPAALVQVRPPPGWTPTQARERAHQIRFAAGNGKDPAAEKLALTVHSSRRDGPGLWAEIVVCRLAGSVSTCFKSMIHGNLLWKCVKFSKSF